LIGARYFSKAIQASNIQEGMQLNQMSLNSPWDYEGHGSHTLSTAGGDFVSGASVFGHGMGTAKGGSPKARVASYKACYEPGCYSLDILAAMLTAVEDGVHVLSLSLGSPPSDYITDPIAIGALYAVRKGVIVVCSGGNSGPEPGTVSNLAPWILTVAASTMDRAFPNYITFGTSTIKVWSSSMETLRKFQRDRFVHAVLDSTDFAGTKSIRRHSACRPAASVDHRRQGQCSKPEHLQCVITGSCLDPCSTIVTPTAISEI
jgi:hypothetical protein